MAGVGTALPPHSYPQDELTAVFAEVVGLREDGQVRLLERLHANSGVRRRHLALPLEAYAELEGFTASNDEFIAAAVDLSHQALTAALVDAGLSAHDVDTIITATVTGLAIPSLDARLVSRSGLRPDVKRMPLVGLGCVAGAAGVARAHDYLLGHPDEVVALVAAELCSLTVQKDDRSTANLVASGLFADGAAAVVMVGADHPAAAADDGPSVWVVDSRSRFYADTERTMGFDVGRHGLRIVLDAQVPALVEEHIAADVDGFLEARGLTRAGLGFWVAHPGGPKVLRALESALETPPGALSVTWDSLAAVGNLSSVSVLHVLHDTLAAGTIRAGERGMMLAMGPGFCSEMVLLEAR